MKFQILILAAALFFACKKDEGSEPPIETLPEITVIDVKKERDSVLTTSFRFFVNLSKSSTKAVSVSFSTAAATAVAGSDFEAKSGVLEFPAGETLGFVDVPVFGKKLFEADKNFFLQLSNPQNATLGTAAKATATITSNPNLKNADASGYTTPLSYAGYNLAWNDEFNGTNIDLNVWKHELGASGWGNNELQNYTASSENSYIAGGALVIEAKKNGTEYTSARMVTLGKKSFKFGRIDIRAKLPKGKGIWPALWMLGADISTIGWPACGEIDIMELVGHEPNKVHGTAHWGAQGSGQSKNSTASKVLPTGDFSEKFHVFSIIWEQDKIRWLLDDVQFHQVQPSTTAPLPYLFNKEFFFIFNVAVGGNWPGSPNASTVFPQKMVVDYVRVFQQ